MKFIFSSLFLFCLKLYAQPIAIYSLSKDDFNILNTKNISMNYSRAYLGKTMTYKSILMKTLLIKIGVKKEHIVELIAKDNFSVYVPAYLFFRTSKDTSVAYLAKEPKENWPKLNNGTNSTAGPFQVIWTDPSYSHISDEYWAWSVTNIAIHKSYPKKKLMPPPKTKDEKIKLGHRIYVSHCASCHTINKIGKAVIGPDLGYLHNPLDYYPNRSELKVFIRNPNKFRAGRMSGSSKAGMNDQELSALIDYFEYLKFKKNDK